METHVLYIDGGNGKRGLLNGPPLDLDGEILQAGSRRIIGMEI